MRKLLNKAALYLDYGAEQVWIAYPEEPVVQVLAAETAVKLEKVKQSSFTVLVFPSRRCSRLARLVILFDPRHLNGFQFPLGRSHRVIFEIG